MPARTYATTYIHPWHEEWCARTTSFDVRRGRFGALRGLIRSPGPALLHGASGFQRGYVDLVAAAALARRGGPVLLAEATWEPGSRAFDRLLRRSCPIGFDAAPRSGRRSTRALIALLDAPALHFGVLSREELESFPRVWGVEASRVHFTGFCATAADLTPRPDGVGVLASGNSLRDYRALVTAAPSLVGPVTIATTLPLPAPPTAAANLRTGWFSPDEHEARAQAAAVIVVALMAGTDRSAGQQTYLNAMARGQAVVVTDAPGVRDYVVDGETGVIVPNDSEALTDAVNRLLQDRPYARRLGAAAREAVMDGFTVRHYFDRLLALADSL